MRVTEIVGQFERVAALLSIGGRRLFGLDTNPVPSDWTHITKVDPETDKPMPLAFPLYLSETSAVSVGGSRGVTPKSTEETFAFMTGAPVPAFHEPSAPEHITTETSEEMAFLAIPEVLNGDSEALIGTLGAGLDHMRHDLGPEMLAARLPISLGDRFEGRLIDAVAAYLMHDAVFEAYIIMNPDSAAARVSGVTEDDLLSPEEAHRRTLAAEYHLESEVVYLEYSGMFGGDEAVALLDAIDEATTWGRVWYGGGLDSRARVEQVLDAGADAVVVGDVFHEIAATENRAIDRARQSFNGPISHNAIRSWLDDEFDIEETAAARYLSTIPDVSRPTERATDYLATAVAFTLSVDSLADDLDHPDESTLKRTVADQFESDETDDDAPELDEETAQRLALTLLGDAFDVETDEAFAGTHLAVEL